MVASGSVQGVFFRASTRDEARRLGVVGWAANRHDGAVEIEAQGPADAVAALVAFVRGGPGHAVVDALEVTDVAPEAEASSRFVVL